MVRLDGAIDLAQLGTPASPASGRNLIYPKADGSWYTLDSSGVESQIQGAGVGTRVSAEFTANSGSIASGAESSDITVTHSLGVTPSVVVGHLEDGSWSHAVGWRVVSKSSSTVVLKFRNAHPTVSATAILRFRLLY